MPFAALSSIDMHYEVIDNCLPHDTLFIHGNLASNRWWQPALKLLQGRGNGHGRAILAEWRGCGASKTNRNFPALKLTDLANDYLEFLKSLSLKKVDVVGHSTGGAIALLAMAKSEQQFVSAVLLDPVTDAGVPFPQEALQTFLQMSKDRPLCEMVMASTVHDVDLKNPFFQELVDDAFAVSPLVWTEIPKAIAAFSKQENPTELFRRIKHPTLIIHGELDPILPKQGSRALSDLLQRATYLEIKGHGHSLNVEDPSLFADKMHDFFIENSERKEI